MKRSLIGLVILAAVAAVAVGATMFDWGGMRGPEREPVAMTIYYGGEKSSFLTDPEVRQIVEREYRITLDARKAGSVEMVTTLDTSGAACLWPSNQVAVELARDAGRTVLSDENVFNSPIVFYAWADVADALESAGIVRRRDDGFLAADVALLGEAISEGRRWREDFGLNIFGPMKIFSTHPAKSNSGNIWAALLATVFNGTDTPTEAALPALLPRITGYFEAMGHMEASSGDIFENFLKQGMGSRPIIVGYENQMIEFLIENAEYAELIRDKVRVIYPEPTIFASHPLIALTPACKRLQEALLDPEVQRLAWARHGFRTGLIGVQNDPADLKVATLPERVDLVVPMPSARVMEAVIAAVR